jgi:hypothetical protein
VASLEERSTTPEQKNVRRGMDQGGRGPQAPNADTAKELARDKNVFEHVLLPLYDLKVVELIKAAQNYHAHVLALECLRATTVNGVDGYRFAQIVKESMEFLEGLPLLRQWNRAIKERRKPEAPPSSDDGLRVPSNPFVFGVRRYLMKMLKMAAAIVTAMIPVLGKAKLKDAQLFIDNEAFIPKAYQTAVGSILVSARSPESVNLQMENARGELQAAWNGFVAAGDTIFKEASRLGLIEHD